MRSLIQCGRWQGAWELLQLVKVPMPVAAPVGGMSPNWRMAVC